LVGHNPSTVHRLIHGIEAHSFEAGDDVFEQGGASEAAMLLAKRPKFSRFLLSMNGALEWRCANAVKGGSVSIVQALLGLSHR
jgi:hypothetical protein